jgi:hypothetical protein
MPQQRRCPLGVTAAWSRPSIVRANFFAVIGSANRKPKTHLTHGDKVRLRLNAVRDGTCTISNTRSIIWRHTVCFNLSSAQPVTNSTGLDRIGRQRKDNEVRLSCVEHRGQVCRVPALARNKAELFQSLYEKSSNVIPAIGDADARLDFSPAKRGDVDPFSALINHERLLMGGECFSPSIAENVASGITMEQSCIKLNHDNLRITSSNQFRSNLR